MADEIRKVPDEIGENIEDIREGVLSDDEAEAAAGGGCNIWNRVAAWNRQREREAREKKERELKEQQRLKAIGR